MNCRVVLVRTQTAANIGAVARVMCNMGLSDLTLVDPRADPTDPQARQLATHGSSVLERCRVVADLGEAVSDCVFVAATSARTGGLYRRNKGVTLHALMPRLLQALAAGPAALVFGPESVGLTNDEISRCHYLIHIPTAEDCPVLNLAQAVAICLYELRRTWLQQASPPLPAAGPAPVAGQERMFAQLRQALEQIGFLYGDRADTLWHAMRHVLGRAQPTPGEVKLLMGLARQLRWFVEHGRTKPAEDGGEKLP